MMRLRPVVRAGARNRNASLAREVFQGTPQPCKTANIRSEVLYIFQHAQRSTNITLVFTRLLYEKASSLLER